jgi:uracil phosphoribosyltransferase
MAVQHPHHPNLTVFDHPLIAHKLAWLRDSATSHRPFRALVYQIAGLMVYEATRDLPTVEVPVQTPVELTRARRLAAGGSVITVVPILRSGLGMAEGIMEMMPEARVGHLGLARDEHTLRPVTYLNRLPKDLDAGPVIVVDPMLATGGSSVMALDILRQHGASDLRLICLVAAPEGVANLYRHHPGVRVYAAALDRQLNDRGFICPGLGDAGDRMYGTT